MESEKVKEIKEKLQEEIFIATKFDDKLRRVETKDLQDILTLINDLESENERLNKSDTSKEESSIEYYNLYKDLKRKNKDLNELCELQRVSIAENFVRENQLKDRIAELEKENTIKTDTIVDLLIKQEFYEKEKLKRFVERVVDKLKNNVNGDNVDYFVECKILLLEVLKEHEHGKG